MSKGDAAAAQPNSRLRTAIAIAGLCFGTATIVIDGGIANVALPTIARDLGIEKADAVLVVTIYQLMLVVAILPFAAIGDRIGLRRQYQAGQVFFGVASLFALAVDSFGALLAVRVCQALGAAACLSVGSAMIRNLYLPRNIGKGLGLNSVIVSGSTALAPAVGGIIVAQAHWSWLFAAAAPLAVISLLLGRALPDPPPRRAPFDFTGALLTASTVGCLIVGLDLATKSDARFGAALVALGLVLGFFLIRFERGITRPVLPVDLLALPVVAISALGSLIVFSAQMLLLVSLPFRLEHDYGFTPPQVGAVIAAWPLTTIFVAPTAGILADKVHAGLLGAIGMVVATTALLLVAFVPPDAGHLDFAWRIALAGAGFVLFMTPNARLIIGYSPRERAAAAGGLVSTMRLTGQTMGATLVAALLAFGIGEGRVPPLVAAGLTVVAGLLSLTRLGAPARSARSLEAEG